ncbi:MAG: anti-sigma F factor [Corallococcus sp.]|nr:anti-sigma F factor [Corallococcus sp.]MCM1359200.1 anti-sigma F factor [Corallococcus sp.]MCM1394590.1 anti-sigma F factor [Corallococcus sp.]
MSNLNSMQLVIDAQSQNEKFARSVVGAFFAQLNPTLEQVEDIKTAVSEAVTNCIVHAYDGQQNGKIQINCQISSDTLFVEIIDNGKGINDVEKAMQPFFTTVSTGERSGMGFTVMQAFCDKVEVSSQNGQTRVKLTKKVA